MPEDVLLQYGALGVLAALALAAVRVLFARVSAHAKSETDRADRLEAEVRRLNDMIQTQYITTLTQATVAMSEAFDAIREINNERRSGKG